MLVELLVENVEIFLPLLAKILPAQSQIPILSHILLEAKEDGLFVTATNIEFGAQINIPAKIIETGKVTLPGKYFIELLASFPKEKISVKKEKETVVIKSRESNFVLQTLPSEEFPKIYEEKTGEKITISKEMLENAFSKILLSISQEDSRPELTGVCISRKKGREEIVTTDGYRLSLFKSGERASIEGEETVILSSKLVQEMVGLKKEGTLYIDKLTNQAIFDAGEVVLVGRLIAGKYPQYEKILPLHFKTKITIDKETFLQEVRLAAIIARENANILKLSIKDGKVIISAKSSGVGEGQATIDALQEGEDTDIAFNSRYLLDILKQFDVKEIVMELNSSLEPARFSDPQKSDYLHIIMPVRVQE